MNQLGYEAPPPARPSGGTALEASAELPEEVRTQLRRTKLAYAGALAFIAVYYARPGDWIPGLISAPVGKVVAVVALLLFLASIVQGARLRLATEMLLLVAFFVHINLCLPFATWRGGSVEVVYGEYIKIVAIALLVATAACSPDRVRRAVFVQTVCVLGAVLVAAVHGQRDIAARLYTGGRAMYANPNDLAILAAVVAPFCLYFAYRTRVLVKKAFWLAMLVCIVYVVVQTYSRGGFLALAGGTVYAAVQLRTAAGRSGAVAILAIVLAAALLVPLAGSRFLSRLETVYSVDSDETGSAQARRQLLMLSIGVALTHPVFGVGPGNFQIYSKSWHASHNTLTGLAAETGFPGLALWVAMVVVTIKKLRRVASSPLVAANTRSLAAAIKASIYALLVSLPFLSCEFQFFPYLLLAYASATCRHALPEPALAPATGSQA